MVAASRFSADLWQPLSRAHRGERPFVFDAPSEGVAVPRRRCASFLGQVDCLKMPRDKHCLAAPLAKSFHYGAPVPIVVHDRYGGKILEFRQGALAETPEELQRGLEGREELQPGEALLLRYGRPEPGSSAPVGDVMRNTPQDLDIGWFDSGGKLLEVAPLHAHSEEVTWSKHGGVAFGLEVPSGTFSSSGAHPGDAKLDMSVLDERANTER
mmetsp:Transcript_42361/g.78962  ORF Transcript_42361/g.78962 Transcript_42361/m.78962 type:complete len:212 (-) Transcript_42361:10-645(-)